MQRFDLVGAVGSFAIRLPAQQRSFPYACQTHPFGNRHKFVAHQTVGADRGL